MGGNCMDCTKWAENIYWSRFNAFHFCLVLPSTFEQQLAIPQKFVNNLPEKLASVIVLRGPSGGTWDVGLVTEGAELVMKHGWKEFVQDHSLRENDILTFKYTGCLRFDVLMFDKENMCEKETSYFVRKCSHTESEHVLKILDEENMCEKETFVKKSGRRESGSVAKKISELESSEDEDNDTLESSDDEFSPSCHVKYRRTTSASRCDARSRLPDARATPRRPRGSRRGKGASRIRYSVELKSNRRKVTDDEKEMTLQRARAVASSDSIVVVMRATHVYRVFYMTIPARWTKGYFPKENIIVELRFDGKKWPMTYQSRTAGGGGLSGGWRNFVVDNCLEESDVCIFDLVNGGVEVIDVKIFRVVEEVVKPTPVIQSTCD